MEEVDAINMSLDEIIQLQGKQPDKRPFKFEPQESNSKNNKGRRTPNPFYSDDIDRTFESSCDCRSNSNIFDRKNSIFDSADECTVHFNSNSLLLGAQSSNWDNPLSLSQRQQRLQQNTSNFFQRRKRTLARNFKRTAKNFSCKNDSNDQPFCRSDCCYSKCMAQRRMLLLQNGLNKKLQPRSSGNGYMSDNESEAICHPLRRSLSMTSLAGTDVPAYDCKTSTCSCDSHISPNVHLDKTEFNFHNSRPNSRGPVANRIGWRSRSRSRERIYNNHLPKTSRKSQQLDPNVQQCIAKLKEEYDSVSHAINSVHCATKCVPLVHSTGMSFHDRFASYYDD